MKGNFSQNLKDSLSDPWAGTRLTLGLLILVVIALTLLTALLPSQDALSGAEQTATVLAPGYLSPTPLSAEDIELLPPIINTNSMLFLGAAILILILIVMLREIRLRRKA